jgi:ApaG protein
MSQPYQFLVEVEPRYLPDQSVPQAEVYGFSYTITVTNTGSVPAQLIGRHWIIGDERGHTEEVKGLGVVGQQPLLAPGETFRYTSGCRLRTAHGSMHGRFFCMAADTTAFEVEIAPFVLSATDPGAAGLHADPDAGGPRVLH